MHYFHNLTSILPTDPTPLGHFRPEAPNLPTPGKILRVPTRVRIMPVDFTLVFVCSNREGIARWVGCGISPYLKMGYVAMRVGEKRSQVI